MTTAEVAAACRVDTSTVLRWVADGKLAAMPLPTRIKRFRREDVEPLITPAVPTEAAS